MVKETSATQLNKAIYLADQKVNKDKSTIMFSKGTNSSLAIKIGDSLNIHSVADHIQYLGSTISIHPNRNDDTSVILPKIEAKLNNCRGPLLSPAGRKVLVQ